MGFREILARPGARTRLWGVVFALCAFAALPSPDSAFENRQNALLSASWIVGGAFAWAIWYRPDFLALGWLLATAFSAVLGWRSEMWMPFALYAMWGLWYRIRRMREESLLRSALILSCVAGLTLPAVA